jgi:hypothetical protein
MTIDHPMVYLFGAVVCALIMIVIFAAIMTALDYRTGRKSPLNHDDVFWKENGDTWLGP